MSQPTNPIFQYEVVVIIVIIINLAAAPARYSSLL